jgi:hypothetical protein
LLSLVTILTLDDPNGELNLVAGVLCLAIGYGIAFFANRQERRFKESNLARSG